MTLSLIRIEYYNGTKKCPILMADSMTGQAIQELQCHTGCCCNWQLKTYTSWGHFLVHSLLKSLWIVCRVGEPILIWDSWSGLDIHAFQKHRFYPRASLDAGEKVACPSGVLKLIVTKNELVTWTKGPSPCMESARKATYISFLINFIIMGWWW